METRPAPPPSRPGRWGAGTGKADGRGAGTGQGLGGFRAWLPTGSLTWTSLSLAPEIHHFSRLFCDAQQGATWALRTLRGSRIAEMCPPRSLLWSVNNFTLKETALASQQELGRSD
ncbi:PREDICTED: uncharacterized protein LOC105555595 [Mandrillus leucophaeus]|uniref:uncharacterized protein LOC105555595 n=1 Tax=Mandrillus leucophaeus TaxID=9568 RepID=UPI0005F4814C|nr:PREDICTED: uncharacterized protein LOC105555595 [Mandrillus leucophaeus]